jgi:anaerobic selenocysteine-containing dehydrogenase
MDRRSFIKLTAISGTSAAIAGCGVPDAQLIRFVPDEDIAPGQATWKPGVCTLCGSGCGLTVRVMDADADVVRDGQKGLLRILAAKKLEGAPMHPVNQGRLCARGQSGIQVTYHPDRITQPLKRSGDRGTGRYEAISWDEAIAELVARLDGLEGAGAQRTLAWIGRSDAGHRRTLIEQFLGRFGAAGPLGFDVLGNDVLRRANALSFGHEQLPTFDLANARYVLSLGADFLGTWNSPVAQSLGYGAMRQGRRGIRGTFVQVESRMTQTGANADEWVPARPGTEGALALGLAHVLLNTLLLPAQTAGRAGALLDGWATGLPTFAPEAVEQMTGVAATRIARLAHELVELRPAVVIVGGPPLAHTNGLFTALAVNALNALLGSMNQPGGVSFTPQLNVAAAAKFTSPVPLRGAGAAGAPAGARTPTSGARGASLATVVADILAGGPTAPQVLLLDGVNPVFTAPPAWRVREALIRVPTIVSFGTFLDETSALADFILPDHSFLESWVDAVPESGSALSVVSVAAPVMRPLHNTRSTVDVLLDVSRRLRRPIAWPWQNYEEMLTASLGSLPPTTPDGDTWSETQQRGGWWGVLPRALTRVSPTWSLATPSLSFAEPTFDGDAEQYPFHFLPYASSTFLDGSLAHLPWLQEMPDPLTSAMWSTWVEINRATAANLGVSDGDIVEVASAHGTLQAGVVVSPGIAPDIVAMPAGQGHTMFTRYASGRGANPFSILAPLTEPDTGALAWAATRVKVSRVGGPDGRLILFAGAMREHGHQDEPPHR